MGTTPDDPKQPHKPKKGSKQPAKEPAPETGHNQQEFSQALFRSAEEMAKIKQYEPELRNHLTPIVREWLKAHHSASFNRFIVKWCTDLTAADPSHMHEVAYMSFLNDMTKEIEAFSAARKIRAPMFRDVMQTLPWAQITGDLHK